ncbi:MAG: hypothetical protein PHE50_08445 [Dehalococcoidales bacterium]|nr:hypothetical protein [Dehalococcoidales bacterium]
MNRDKEYPPWLKKLGVDFIQLRFFGMENNTDYYTGRKGAYRELLKSIDIMLDYGMVPRIQMFPFTTNIGDFIKLQDVFEGMRLDERCRKLNREFVCYFHLPTADGEAFHLEGIRINRQESVRLPDYFIQKTKQYFKSDNMENLWQTEAELLPELLAELKPFNDTPFFETLYVTGDFAVYPNISSQDPWWRLGNLKTDGVDVIMDNYINHKNLGLQMNYEIPVKYFAAKYGNPAGEKLFAGKDSILAKWWKLEGINHEKGVNAVRD